MIRRYQINKQNYNELKGGVIDKDRVLEEINTNCTLPDLNISEPDIYEKITDNLFWDDIVTDEKNFIWTHDISKPCYKLEQPINVTDLNLKYEPNRRLVYAYFIEGTDTNIKIIDALEEMTQIDTPGLGDIPYKYEPIIPIFGVPINLFTNLFSEKMHEYFIDKIILKWMKTRYGGIDPKTNSFIYMPTKDAWINKQISYISNAITQPAIKYNSKGRNFPVKIHICVKLEYLFWTLDKLLSNLSAFIDKRTFRIDKIKIIDRFANYNYYEEFISDYPSREQINESVSGDGLTYKIEEPGDGQTIETMYKIEKMYKRETIHEANIVIYPAMYPAIYPTDPATNQQNISSIIKILLALFPNQLNISSKKFPRFNFKVNDNIYVGFGDGDDKEQIISDIPYDQPIEYKIECEETDEKECLGKNNVSRILTNHELCVIEDMKCKTNNVLSRQKLVYRTTPKELVINGKQLNSIENIYEFLGVDHNNISEFAQI